MLSVSLSEVVTKVAEQEEDVDKSGLSDGLYDGLAPDLTSRYMTEAANCIKLGSFSHQVPFQNQ